MRYPGIWRYPLQGSRSLVLLGPGITLYPLTLDPHLMGGGEIVQLRRLDAKTAFTEVGGPLPASLHSNGQPRWMMSPKRVGWCALTRDRGTGHSVQRAVCEGYARERIIRRSLGECFRGASRKVNGGLGRRREARWLDGRKGIWST